MTPAELARLRALCEAATPGPWDPKDDGVNAYSGTGMVADFVFADDDAAFIAAARTALPALLDEVERLTILVDAQRKDLGAQDDDGSCSARDAAEEYAFRRGTDAMMKEALGDQFGRLWGPPLEALGRQMDRLRAEGLAAESALSRARAEAINEAAGIVHGAVTNLRAEPVTLMDRVSALALEALEARIRALPLPDTETAPAQQTGGGEPTGPWEWGATMAYREQGMDLVAASAKAHWLNTQLRRTDAPHLWHLGPAPAAQTTPTAEEK